MKTDIMTETIIGQIIPKANNYLAVPDGQGERRIIKNDAVRSYERSFCLQCVKYKNKRIGTQFRLFAEVWQRSARFDLDNSLKTLLDCLQYVNAITDDNLCVEIVARKRIDPVKPRVKFAIVEICEEQSLFDLHEEYSQKVATL